MFDWFGFYLSGVLVVLIFFKVYLKTFVATFGKTPNMALVIVVSLFSWVFILILIKNMFKRKEIKRKGKY